MPNTRMMVMLASLERLMTEERKAVHEAIIGQQAIPVGLAYPAIPANYIHKLNLQCIGDADYVLLVVGQEYGPVTDKGVGYLHAAYSAALAARKPIISLIYSGEVRLASDSFDEKRLAGLVALLKKGLVYEWSNIDELRDGAELGLEYAFETFPSLGWTKVSSIPQAVSARQNVEEQNVVQKLKNQVSQLKERVQLFSNSNEKLKGMPDLSGQEWTAHYQCNAFREGRLKQFTDDQSLSLDMVIEWIGPTLLTPVTEKKIQAVVARHLQPTLLVKIRSIWPGSHAVSDIKVSLKSIESLKVKLRVLELVEFDQQGRWKLTSMGERLVLDKEVKR